MCNTNTKTILTSNTQRAGDIVGVTQKFARKSGWGIFLLGIYKLFVHPKIFFKDAYKNYKIRKFAKQLATNPQVVSDALSPPQKVSKISGITSNFVSSLLTIAIGSMVLSEIMKQTKK